jgi:hypothetical protein
MSPVRGIPPLSPWNFDAVPSSGKGRTAFVCICSNRAFLCHDRYKDPFSLNT